METIKFKVTGMSCEHCVKRVEESVLTINGVEKVKVHLKKGIAKVKYNQQLATPAKISDAVIAAGYEASIVE
ncbi:copper chaperone [Carnobacterium maltaromaticum]|uniref:copper ion binding protein n=1 Tax=Carnobacterium maltaromaticum TaxID=2751 RepID=UPI000C772B75|nr:copper ion binding protein [Carnobacterium maltaromaticum]PLS34667.1 copper chaperone [Carnobacterium maltaromaticum]PLS36485.1 copper chaperone [Carnobacterium maltaromaticum]PLS37300.1 copper chaperone [Carnobacterium maltaromaticum]PLS43516.1 copper chaperone [Carnobacterium maltaromaticum]PLS43861.1 copper chaperone [Carnobacterium maltaromaticum]